MAAINSASAFDMTSFDLADLRDGTNTAATDADWRVTGAAATNDYDFFGSGLTYHNGRPNGGTVGSFVLNVAQFNITGSISGKLLGKFVAHNNPTALFKEWFRNDDLFNMASGNDHLFGYHGNDSFDLSLGGEDIADGGDGQDTFLMGQALSSGDRLIGGTGTDTLALDGDVSFVFNASTINGVEKIQLAPGHTYDLSLQGANIPTNGLTVDGRDLGLADGFTVDVLTATTHSLTLLGGRGDDSLGGSDGSDSLRGNRGNDAMFGGKGGDVFAGGNGADSYLLEHANESTGLGFDTIEDFHPSEGDFFILTTAVDEVKDAVTSGTLSNATFNADLEAAIGKNQMGKHDAAVFIPDAGDFAGQAFLIIDANGNTGFQQARDYVILLDDASEVGNIVVGTFNLEA